MDSDDLLIPNALNILFQYAEKSNAEVVGTCRYFNFEVDADKPFPKELKISERQYEKFPQAAFLNTENPIERVQNFYSGPLNVMPWLKFSRRDFLIDNEIYFPATYANEDHFWTLDLFCNADRFLIIPEPLYIKRNTINSIINRDKTPAEQIRFHMHYGIVGAKIIEKLASKNEVLQKNPQLCYHDLKVLVDYRMQQIFNHCANLNQYQVYEIFKQQFAQETGEQTELISYLCSMINMQQKILALANNRIAELEKNSV